MASRGNGNRSLKLIEDDDSDDIKEDEPSGSIKRRTGGSARELDLAVISEDEPDNPSDQEWKWEFMGLDAYKLVEFCEQTLIELQGQSIVTVLRDPPIGPAKKLTIRCIHSSKDYEKVSVAVGNLTKEIAQISDEQLDVTEEEFTRVKELMLKPPRDNETSVKVLFDENTKTRIWVSSSSYEAMKQTLHKIQVHLGRIKTTGVSRSARNLVDSDTSSSHSFTTHGHGSDSTYERQSSNDRQSSNERQSSPDRRQSSPDRRHSPSYKYSTDDAWDKTEFRFQTVLQNGFILKVYKASILHLKVDTIVNAANDNLMHGGGVAFVIAKAAGWELDKEGQKYLEKYGNIRVTQNMITTAGNLDRYKSVIHAVGPQWHDYHGNKAGCLDDVYKTVLKVLKTCENRHYGSVAMPAISAGIYGVPKPTCADMYIKAAVDFASNRPSYLLELHIVDVDMEILKLVKKSFEKWQTKPESVSPSQSLSDYNASDQSSSSSHDYTGSRQVGRRGQGRHGNATGGYHGNLGSDSGGGYTGQQSKIPDLEHKERFQLSFSTGYGDKFYLKNSHLTVNIYTGSVAKISGLDAVASGIDTTLSRGGQTGSALESAGGSVYRDALSKMKTDNRRYKPIGEVLKCKGGNLGAKDVLHLVMSLLKSTDHAEMQKYRTWIYNLLTKANGWGIRTLAVSLLGSAAFAANDLEIKLLGRTFLAALSDYTEKDKYQKIRELHLVNIDSKVSQHLTSLFHEALPIKPGLSMSVREGSKRNFNIARQNSWSSSSEFSRDEKLKSSLMSGAKGNPNLRLEGNVLDSRDTRREPPTGATVASGNNCGSGGKTGNLTILDGDD